MILATCLRRPNLQWPNMAGMNLVVAMNALAPAWNQVTAVMWRVLTLLTGITDEVTKVQVKAVANAIWAQSTLVSYHESPGPCITNVIATCRKNFSQWERSFHWKLRCHWLKYLRRVAKTLVIQGPSTWVEPGPMRHPFSGAVRSFCRETGSASEEMGQYMRQS